MGILPNPVLEKAKLLLCVQGAPKVGVVRQRQGHHVRVRHDSVDAVIYDGHHRERETATSACCSVDCRLSYRAPKVQVSTGGPLGHCLEGAALAAPEHSLNTLCDPVVLVRSCLWRLGAVWCEFRQKPKPLLSCRIFTFSASCQGSGSRRGPSPPLPWVLCSDFYSAGCISLCY